jgi:hypothetical protein
MRAATGPDGLCDNSIPGQVGAYASHDKRLHSSVRGIPAELKSGATRTFINRNPENLFVRIP